MSIPPLSLKSNHLDTYFKEHSNSVKEEVVKLKQASAIKEVFYPEWLDNIVVMRKKNGK